MIKPIVCDYSIEGRGLPLFLIHGIGAARDAWRFMIPKLSEHFTVISYDLRGHGISPKSSYEFDELITYVFAINLLYGIDL